MNYSLYFPTSLDSIDALNDNIDVCVKANGKHYTFTVATPSNLYCLMKKDDAAYLKPGAPFLFVEKLTEKNIRSLIEAVIEDTVLLHVYGEDLW